MNSPGFNWHDQIKGIGHDFVKKASVFSQLSKHDQWIVERTLLSAILQLSFVARD